MRKTDLSLSPGSERFRQQNRWAGCERPRDLSDTQGGVVDRNDLKAEFRVSVRSGSLAVGYTFVAPSFEQQKSSQEDASSRDSVHLASVKDY